MEIKFKNIAKMFLGVGLCLSITSCEDYLDKAPDTDISENEAFKNFTNFQGYVEQIYAKIPNKFAANWSPSWNWGEDELFNVNDMGRDRMTSYIDIGDFRRWYQNNPCWLKRSYVQNDPQKSNGLYNNMWEAIRIANVGLESLDKVASGALTYSGSQEELNFLRGQLLFFRAWWHFEMACYVGGLPYIDKPFSPTEEVDMKRLTYPETLRRCADDFKAAADLLPENWDNTASGRDTRGGNDMRINKTMALAYYGKAALWLASPLAKQGAKTGGDTYDYDTETAKEAAEAFGKILASVEAGSSQYKLAEFKYTDIYNHDNGGSLGEYTKVFYTHDGHVMPGEPEAIFRGLCNSGDGDYSLWQYAHVWGPKFGGMVIGDNLIHQPTANYVHYAYGMANGLPLDDPKSGFDPTHPWKDRDPRFYHDIIFDGFKFISGEILDANANLRPYQYCEMFTGGNMRDDINGSRTGYLIQKLVPHTSNIIDKKCEYMNFFGHISYVRLADIYLMYAEAVSAGYGSPSKSAPSCNLSAVDAINVVRARCGAGPVGGDPEQGHVNNEYLTNNKLFMDEVRRERACELSFEGFRYCDLQRWLLLTEKQTLLNGKVYDYTEKCSVEFTRVIDDIPGLYKADKKYDPRNAEVKGYSLKPILKRNFTATHYWFPLPIDQTYYSENFQQNPGW